MGSPVPVCRGELGALSPVDADPVTRAFDVRDRRPGLPYPLRYREIRPHGELPPGVDAGRVRDALAQAMVARERCSGADRSELDARTDWAVALVEHRGVVVGVLQPGLPEEFLSTTAATGRRRALTLRDLCASDESARVNGLDRSAVDADLARLALVAHLAHTIHLLHRNRIAYSDLTLDRVAIAGRPPRTLLIGTDPVAALSEETGASRRSRGAGLDPSRLALCVVRALAKGPGATQLTDAHRVEVLLGRRGVELVERALRPAPDPPPSAEQISRYLVARLGELARDILDRAALPRFDIAGQVRGLLPRLAVPALPVFAAARAALPHRPLVSTDEHPPPRLQAPSIDLDLTGIRPGLPGDGLTDVGGAVARAYGGLNHQLAAALRDAVTGLRSAIAEPTHSEADTGRPLRP
jgi:hypothetical protein